MPHSIAAPTTTLATKCHLSHFGLAKAIAARIHPLVRPAGHVDYKMLVPVDAATVCVSFTFSQAWGMPVNALMLPVTAKEAAALNCMIKLNVEAISI